MDDEERQHAMAILRAVLRNDQAIMFVEQHLLQLWQEQAEAARDSLLAMTLTTYGVALAFLGLYLMAMNAHYALGAIAFFAGGCVSVRRYLLVRKQESKRAEAFEFLQSHSEELRQFLADFTDRR